ncbi:MAG: DNA-directed RNA polymerase subunit N [Candidatus Micrarchaeia archaeon]
MMFPVRCFTCGAVVADKYEEYRKRVGNGENPKDVLDSMKISRYCCRRMFLTHVDNVKEIIRFSRF